MEKVLEIINDEFTKLNLEYYYMTNTSPVVNYPYITGEFTEAEYSYEDNSAAGDLLLEVWNRGDKKGLIEAVEKIKMHFRDLRMQKDGMTVFFAYDNAFPIRTNDESLDKIEVHITINYFEGA